MGKILISTFLLLSLAAITTGCSKVPAGQVGVKVYLLGGSKGVETETLGTGRYWIGFNEELYLFPVFKQTYPFTAASTEGSPDNEEFSFQTAEGLTIKADVGVTARVDKEKVSYLFQTYRLGLEEIMHGPLRNTLRDAFNKIGPKYKSESAYGTGKTSLMNEVLAFTSEKFAKEGIIIDNITLLSDFRLPDSVKNALNNKIEAIQRSEQREYELREAEAEAKKKIAIAEGEAKANAVRMQTINDNLIKYEQILNDREAIKKWDGKSPETLILGQGSTTFMLPQKK